MLKRLSSQAIPNEIQDKLDLFFEELKEVGVAYIGHGVVSDQGNHTGYFSDKKWGELYVQNQYFFDEPILNNYEKNEIDLISWGKVEDQHSIAHIRNEFTNVISGVTICKKDNGFNTFFNLGFKQDIDLARFSFLKKDIILEYFTAFNKYHLLWRKQKFF